MEQQRVRASRAGGAARVADHQPFFTMFEAGRSALISVESGLQIAEG